MNQEMKKLKICFTSDVHGYFYPTSYGDLLKKPMGLFGCADSFHKDENTLVIDGGDILQGSAFAYHCSQMRKTPKLIAEVMNACGYDYYTIGNHDFNYGTAYQAEYHKAHQGKCICQNVIADDGSVPFPYDIRVMENGLRVGLVGIVTDYIHIWEKPENLTGVRIADPFAAAKQALEELKGKVDVTVCVYHGGFERDIKTGDVMSTTTENVGYKICEELNFDILLTGHQHMHVDGQVCCGTYVVQPMEYAREYHCVEVTVADGVKTITSECRRSDAEMQGLGLKLQEQFQAREDEVQQWLDQPMGHLSRALLPGEKAEMALHGSPIADLLNDVQLHFTGAQISAVCLANEIAGFNAEVSVRDIIATYPYPNTLLSCRVSGAQLRRAMERSAEYLTLLEDGTVTVSESFLVPKVEHYNYDYYGGVDYTINPAKPMGSRIENLTYQGKPVEDDDSFTLCMNNYRYTGAGGYEVYNECELVKEVNIEMVELIMNYFTEKPYIEV